MINDYKKYLVVVAHPDDEVLGCGGTIKKLSRSNKNIKVIFIAEGTSCRSRTNRSPLKPVAKDTRPARARRARRRAAVLRRRAGRPGGAPLCVPDRRAVHRAARRRPRRRAVPVPRATPDQAPDAPVRRAAPNRGGVGSRGLRRGF